VVVKAVLNSKLGELTRARMFRDGLCIKLEDMVITEKLMIAYIPETMDTHSANSVWLKAGTNWLGTVTERINFEMG